MLRFILISLALILGCNAYASDSNDKDLEKTVSDKFFKGLFLDLDIIEPIRSVASDNHRGANFSLAANLKNKFFPTVLVGYSDINATSDYSNYFEQDDSYEYKVKGPYFKIGLDFQIISADPINKYSPMAFVGARFAYSRYDYSVLNSSVSNGIWGDDFSYSQSGKTSARWGEINAGVKVPVVGHLFLGFEGSYKFAFKAKSSEATLQDSYNKVLINQSYSPGYGDDNASSWGIRYMISYYFN